MIPMASSRPPLPRGGTPDLDPEQLRRTEARLAQDEAKHGVAGPSPAEMPPAMVTIYGGPPIAPAYGAPPWASPRQDPAVAARYDGPMMAPAYGGPMIGPQPRSLVRLLAGLGVVLLVAAAVAFFLLRR